MAEFRNARACGLAIFALTACASTGELGSENVVGAAAGDASGLSIDAPSPTSTADTSGALAGASAAAVSQAAFQKQTSGTNDAIRLQQVASDGTALCVDIVGESTSNGSRAELWTCNGQKNQSFALDGALVRVYGNKCLNVVDRVDANGTQVQIWECSEQDAAMAWTYSNGHLRWKGTNKCLDVKDGVFAKGTSLQLWTCNETSPNQLFVAAGFEVAAGPAGTPATEGTPTAPSASGNTAKSPSTGSSPTASVSGSTLALAAWQQEVWGARAFNNEQQSYTNRGANVSFASDGTATLVARPTGGSSWTSARLSGDVMGALPWYLEADLVAPTGKGSWPAFWLTSRGPWPQGGEIDVMEQVNGAKQTHISTHWGPNTGNATFNTHEIIDNFSGGERHRYGVWATAQGLQFYLDGKKVGAWVTFPAQSNFAGIASQMVPVVNIAMGGDWPGYAPQTSAEQKMVVYRVSRDVRPPAG